MKIVKISILFSLIFFNVVHAKDSFMYAAAGGSSEDGRLGICVGTKLPSRAITCFDIKSGLLWSKNMSPGGTPAQLVARAVINGDLVIAASFDGMIQAYSLDGKELIPKQQLFKETVLDIWSFHNKYIFVKTAEWSEVGNDFQFFFYKTPSKPPFKILSTTRTFKDGVIVSLKDKVFAVSEKGLKIID